MSIMSDSCLCLCVFSLAPGSSPTSVTAWRRRAAWRTCARSTGTTSSSGPTSRSVLSRRLALEPNPPPGSSSRHISGPLNVLTFPVSVRLCSVGGDRQAVQPPEAGRHVGEASPETDQISPPPEERDEEDGRAVGPRHCQQHGEEATGCFYVHVFYVFRVFLIPNVYFPDNT